MSDYYSIEEDFHAADRKASRKERKYAQQNDRSKYKKTDQNKETKENTTKNTKLGRVLSVSSQKIEVALEEGNLICSLRGNLKLEKTLQKNIITIGDIVHVDERGQISSVEKRYSYLARADNLRKRKQHIIAANIDQVLITVSVAKPALKPSLIDRYVIAAQKGNMRPIIIVNKIDLLEKGDTLIDTLEKVYVGMDIPFVRVSCVKKKGLKEIKALMKGKTSVFSGQSGVGKTSLINEILGTNLKVGEVVEKTSKGVHTTTSAHLVPLAEGGFCVDTPGIKSFALWDISSSDLLTYFHDLQSFASSCKFPNCTHVHEPDCGVIAATLAGKLSKQRYESYLTIKENNDNDQKNSWE